MTPYPHQVELSKVAIDILKENMIVYLALEERTGKTLTSILVAEACNITSVLVITKKNAIKGWMDTLKAFSHKKIYTVTNYHQAIKQAGRDFDLVILDEAHNYISSYPKPGKIYKEVGAVAYGKPIIYISATPHAQGNNSYFINSNCQHGVPGASTRTFTSGSQTTVGFTSEKSMGYVLINMTELTMIGFRMTPLIYSSREHDKNLALSMNQKTFCTLSN